MLDRFLSAASTLDWITPSWAFVQDFLNSPISDFGIPEQAGWTRRDIRRLLKRHGIRVWGLLYSGGILIFTVRKAQARWAYYVLERAGVPILYAPADVFEGSGRDSVSRPTNTNPIDRFFEYFDRFG